jgi:putative membrane protein
MRAITRLVPRASIWIVMFVTALSAHGQEPTGLADPRVFSAWDKLTLAALIVSGGLYLTGFRRLRMHGAVQSALEPWAFVVGWSTLVAAVLPPLDAASIARFSAHMVQHELMMLVGAPLVMAGRPLSTCLWALPASLRRAVATPLQHRRIAGGIRVVTAPLLAWAVHGGVIWLWHLPALYELAVVNESAHALQHAMFVGTSMLFWWGLLCGRYGRAGYGAAVFYVFTTAVHTGILGALITFAGAPIYAVYAALPGRDALADQQVAGLVMWIPAGALLTLAGIGFFAAWLGEADRRLRNSGPASGRAARG